MIRRNWNVAATTTVELWQVDGTVQVAHDARVLPEFMLQYVAPDDGCTAYELIIEFTSRGYYQSASMYGGPERLGWPEEGDDERTMDKVSLLTHAKGKKVYTQLPPNQQDELFEFFLDDVEAETLDDAQ